MVQYNVNLLQVIKIMQSQNAINPTGEVNTDDISAPLHTRDITLRSTISETRLSGRPRTGAVIRLGDIAGFKREYAEPENKITVNGRKAILLAIQMYEAEI